MAAQAAQIADTIAGMKRAAKRKAYGKTSSPSFSTISHANDEESDSSIEHLTNRGNKLRKRSRFVHEGQLAPPTGPQAYKKTIEHASYSRDIISRNPPLIDEDGYEVDSEDDDERAHNAIAAAAENDPYSEVKIETLFKPLTAASDLPNHPTLSKPFTSEVLTDLTQNIRDMVQKEKATLWKMKQLLTRLSGDSTWIPCESVETPDDFALFFDDREKQQAIMLGKAIPKDADQASTGTLVSDDIEQRAGFLTADAQSLNSGMEAVKQLTNAAVEEENAIMAPVDGPVDNRHNGKQAANASAEASKATGTTGDSPKENGIGISVNGKDPEVIANGPSQENGAVKDSTHDSEQPNDDVEMDGEGGADDAEDLPVPRRMRTRAQAQAASDNTASIRTRSMTPESNNEPSIHPYFLASESSRADRDVGLPPHEAEETRRLLQLYIQKQEEACRGLQILEDGLLHAERARKEVLKWCKAEGHVGANRDMSDGEDWYDKDEWGLTEDLKKGQDEEEEDAATTAKKTRTRRQ
ncbi:Transcriptional regulatory protein [Lachnellula willkommii]|uniref:Transcriptional regulatory protein n=1 Tax=Lachnellula willkommii TaxID=215461 RepID=A0A559M6M2_9HELO|nr:Transcriptional regulatory protein [Lachnellula willkommii]